MKWDNSSKEIFSYIIAALSLLFGFSLTAVGFAVDPLGIVSESVLWVLGQVFVFAGAILGVSLSIEHNKNKVKNELSKDIKKYIDAHIKKNPPELSNDESDC